MSEFSDIRLFTLVARHRSLAAAARELGVTPPAVSKRLAHLEKRLGVRLTHRTTRRLTLTPEGERYLVEGSRLLGELQELEQVLIRGHAEPAGLLRVNASYGFGRARVAPAISAFVARYPAIRVQLQLTDQPLNLREHGYDIGIRFGDPPSTRINARLLLRNHRLLCASPAYVARNGRPAVPHDLVRHACLIVRENDAAYGAWHFRRGKSTETVKVDNVLSSNDGNAVLRWTLDGHGIAIRSAWEIAPYLARGELIPLLGDWKLPNADIYATYLERSEVSSAKVRAFLDFTAKYLATS